MVINSTFITITFLSLLLLISFSSQKVSSAATVPKTYTNFIRTNCNTTTYPSLCISTLTPYASAVKTNKLSLCKTALNVAISGAKNASTSVKSLISSKGLSKGEAALIRECIGDMKDAVYELKDTLDAMGHLSDPDRDFQWSNAKTRASAAITDAETCRDAFTDRKVGVDLKKKVASYVTGVEKLISNALSLINHLY